MHILLILISLSFFPPQFQIFKPLIVWTLKRNFLNLNETLKKIKFISGPSINDVMVNNAYLTTITSYFLNLNGILTKFLKL